MNPVISDETIIRPPMTDEIGILLSKIQKEESWTAMRKALLKNAVQLITKQKHIKFESDYRLFRLSKVGSSLVCVVPDHKQGYLKTFRNQRIRLVCVGSGSKSRRQYIAYVY